MAKRAEVEYREEVKRLQSECAKKEYAAAETRYKQLLVEAKQQYNAFACARSRYDDGIARCARSTTAR